jgi:anti-anti-sigma factor
MKVTIWGARGSVPAPLTPAAVREKIVSALLSIGDIEKGELREELISTILEAPHLSVDTSTQALNLELEEAYEKAQRKRRQLIEHYLEGLSPLAGSTAGGNTPCVEIRSDDDLFIIDAGSGIRELGLELMKGPWGRGDGVIHLFFSHPHWDHIQGFPFFRPAFIPGNKIFIYSVHDMETVLRSQQSEINFPVSVDYMQASLTFKRIEPGEVCKFDDLSIRTIANHHPGKAYGYRFEKGNKVFVYASDASYPDDTDLRPYLNFFDEADLLIFDAQFTQRESDEKEDWGHSSSFMGVEMAQQAKVKTMLLYHHDPRYSDRDLEKILETTLKFQQNQYPAEIPVNVMIAQEGQTFDLTPSQTTQIQQVPGSKAAILKPSGIFDEHVAAELKEQFAEMIRTDRPTQLIIDMSEVELLQVAGLRALVKLRKDSQSIPMALAGLSLNVRQLIELAGYIDFFAIYPSVHTALNALKTYETINLLGQTLKNRYRIEAKIGDGRLGSVFKAVDLRKDMLVAVKILSPSFSEGAIQQFLRQARQIVDLIHPNIVNVYDCDEDRGLSFMVEELIERKTLQDLTDEHQGHPLSFKLALNLAQSIVGGLQYAHAHGVVHGDLKPKNILLDDEVKISDFGLGQLEGGRTLLNINVPLAPLTAHYLAPEQISGQTIDPRTDLYTLGVVLYELFTGHSPFEGNVPEPDGGYHTASLIPPRQLNPDLSRSLEHLILKLMAKDPDKRYQSARQILNILTSMSVFSSDRVNNSYPFINRSLSTFVNRGADLQRLEGLWRKAQQGQGQIVLLRGASGLGKSSLIQEFMARLDKVTLLVGNCQKSDYGPAYHPFVSGLEAYFNTISTDQTLHPNEGEAWFEVAQLIPEVRRLIPASLLITSRTLPQSTSSTLIQALKQATQQQPWLLILDDLQWADQNSLYLLAYLARHAEAVAMMIIGAYTEENEAEPSKALTNILTILSEQPNCTTIALEPLSQEEVKSLVESINAQSVPVELIAAIHKLTKGNPLYVKQIIKGLIDEGVMGGGDNKWHFGPVVEMGLPQSVSQTISRRIGHLSRETQALLTQAAILGPIFQFEDLHELSDLSEWDALESLEIALERQLLTCTPDKDVIAFSHIEVQQVLYEGLSSLKRRLMHREAGEALERRYPLEPHQRVEALAYHFLQAGELEKGLHYCIQAALQAKSSYASQSALYWYSIALDVMDQLGQENVSPQQRFELLLAREQIYNDQGNRHAQITDLTALQNLAQSLNDPAKQALVHKRQSTYQHGMNHLSEALTEAQAGLIAARQSSNPILESESLIQLAYLAMYQGELNLAREHLRTAQINLTKTNDHRTMGESLNGLGTLYLLLNDNLESEKCYQRALNLAQTSNDRYLEICCLNNLGKMSLGKGDFDAVMACHQQALALSQLIGYRQGEATAFNGMATFYKNLGEYELARDQVEQAILIHRQIEDEQGLADDLQILGGIHRATNDYVAARDYIGQALEIFQRVKNKVQQGATWLELALAFEGLKDFAKARHAYEQVQALQAELKGDISANFDTQVGLARCSLGEAKAEQAYREVEPCLKALPLENKVFGLKYPLRFYLTLFEVLRANQDAAGSFSMLQQGQVLLQQWANTLSDPQLQTSFLENVSEHRAFEIYTQQATEVKNTNL